MYEGNCVIMLAAIKCIKSLLLFHFSQVPQSFSVLKKLNPPLEPFVGDAEVKYLHLLANLVLLILNAHSL